MVRSLTSLRSEGEVSHHVLRADPKGHSEGEGSEKAQHERRLRGSQSAEPGFVRREGNLRGGSHAHPPPSP